MPVTFSRQPRNTTTPIVPMDVEILHNFVTSGYLMKLFRRREATIFLWRRGRGLPFIEIPGDGRVSIRYDVTKVIRWAKDNKIRTYPVLKETG
jgi:hypothetical protein